MDRALVAVTFNDTITLGAVIIALLVIVVGGFPLRLIQTLRVERDELQHQVDIRTEEIGRLRGELAKAQARTDLEPVLVEIKNLVGSVERMAETSSSRHERFAQGIEANAKLIAGLVEQQAAGTELLRELAQELLNGRTP